MMGPEHTAASANEGGAQRVWFSSAAAMRALDRMELDSFREQVEQLASGLAPLAVEAPGPTLLFLYDVLRATADRLTVADGGVDESQRLVWINTLGGLDDGTEAVRYFLREIEQLLAPFTAFRSPINPIVLKARHFIEEHSSEPVSLSRVATELGVARNYLSSLFRKECGITLTEFIHQVRIEKARRLLHGGGGSLSGIAQRVGYRNYRHFYRSFMRVCDVSPTTFVKRLRTVAREARAAEPAPRTPPRLLDVPPLDPGRGHGPPIGGR